MKGNNADEACHCRHTKEKRAHAADLTALKQRQKQHPRASGAAHHDEKQVG